MGHPLHGRGPTEGRRHWLRRAAAVLLCAWPALWGGGCSKGGAGPAPGSVTLYAASSLRDALQALQPALEQAVDGELVLNLGSSGDLARQILAGGHADVFISADELEMNRLADRALVADPTRRALLGNRLVVIEPAAGPAEEPTVNSPDAGPAFDPASLAQPRIRLLSLANVETVPAGRYAKAWLERRGLWERVQGRVLPGVDARAALAAVESGGAQAGIVYRSDALRSRRVRIVHEVDPDEAPEIVYPCARLRASQDPERARKLLEFLAGDAARAEFQRQGFEVR